MHLSGTESRVRSKPSHVRSVYFLQMCQDDVKWKTVVFSTNGAGTIECTHAMDEVWILSLHLQSTKNQS